MMKQPDKTVTKIACGNTWDQLEGEDSSSSKQCAECKRKVYNLANISNSDLNHLKSLPPKSRTCVVFEPLKLFKQLDKAHLLKVAATLLIGLLMCEQAIAEDKLEDAEYIIGSCDLSYYSPMFISPEAKCIDENYKKVTVEEWQKTHPFPSHRNDRNLIVPPGSSN